MRQLSTLMFACALLACGEPFSNDDLVFLKSLPNSELVRLGLPSAPGAALSSTIALGEQASGARDARRVADTIDGAIAGAYALVDTVTAYPPSAREAETRAWGPIPNGENELVLFVTRTSTPGVRVPTATTSVAPLTEVFEFALQGRRRGEEPLATLMAGSFAESGGPRRGLGQLYFDFEQAQRLDPTAAGRGQLYIGYDTRRATELVLGGVNAVSDDGEIDSFARLERSPEGAIDFRYGWRTDLQASPDGTPTSALETIFSVNRFLPDRRGRSDLVIGGGDLLLPGYASECWDERFRRTYFEGQPTEWFGPKLGTAEACAPPLSTFATLR